MHAYHKFAIIDNIATNISYCICIIFFACEIIIIIIIIETTHFHSLITHTHTCGKYVAHDTLTHRQSLKQFLLAYVLRSSCPLPFSHPSSTWAREWGPGSEHGKG